MEVPDHLRQYPCDDYFASMWSATGFWCETSQLMVVVPTTDVEELREVGFLSVGRAGVDGILFGYRLNESGVWVYSPISRDFQLVATSVSELVQKWIAGEVFV